MSWLDRVRDALPFVTKRATPDKLWHKCRQCQQMVFVKEWRDNLSVCPRCDHHDRIGAKQRFGQLFDDGLYTLIAAPSSLDDPLKFKDSKKYSDRLKTARSATESQDALQNAYGKIGEHGAVVGVQNFAFMGGSMGIAVGEAFVAGTKAAIKHKYPYIIATAAGGARMQEGLLSLMQMPKTIVALTRLRRAGLPYIVLLTDPTTGGVTASYAMLGDVQISEPKALIGFAGQRVIENTIREKLPEGFQRAEYLLEHGMIDMVVHRRDMAVTLGRLIAYLAPDKAKPDKAKAA